MGDRAFARARTAKNNATEAGQARAKAEVDLTSSPPEERRDLKMTREKNTSIPFSQPGRQPNTGGAPGA